MTPITLIIGGLATWRLTHAIVRETGPLMYFARLRAFLARRQKRSGGFFDAISCTSCFSFWIALLAALLTSHDIFHLVGYALAFSGESMILEAFFTKQTNSLPLVTPPATDNKVSVGVSSTPKKRDNVVGNPYPSYGKTAITASTLLDN